MKKWFTITLTFADGTQGGYPHEAYSLKEATQDSVGLFSAASDVVSVTVSTDSPASGSDGTCPEHDWETLGIPQGVYQCRKCGEIG